jgi:hypothetical protein
MVIQLAKQEDEQVAENQQDGNYRQIIPAYFSMQWDYQHDYSKYLQPNSRFGIP